MSGMNWIKRPLWEEVEDFTGERHADDGTKVVLSLYEKMDNLITKNARRAEFQSTLSASQYNSFRIIEEWWSCRTEEDPWFRTNKDREKALEILEMYPALEQASPLVVQIVFGTGPIIPRFSTYRLQVWRLFQMEFDPADSKDEDPHIWRRFLQKQRQSAAFYASVQRLCFPFHTYLNTTPDTSFRSNSKDQRIESLGNILTQIIGTSIEPCPWLELHRERSNYPFYLWDVEGERTVPVRNLEHEPKYICISHTWGRWHDPASTSATIRNVPWLVPRNSRFDVEKLPEMLKEAFPMQYIWLDLFCIPQDRSELALLEISRQARIFGMARAVISWLFEVVEWNGILQTIEWLARFCIMNRGDAEEILPKMPDAHRTGIVLENDIQNDQTINTPIGWFTSLWTLQEACLRPDMLLCNRDFEILTIGSSIPVTLDSLTALVNFSVGFYPYSSYETLLNRQRIPRHLELGTVSELEQFNLAGSIRRRRALEKQPEDLVVLRDLYDVFVMSGMNMLYNISPTAVFYLGQRRQCTASRAEAIMSVVGATDWFHRHVSEHHSAPSETDLVLGLYPSVFLNEAAQKTGATFYATVASNLLNLQDVVDISDGLWRSLDTSQAVGSLLPFTTTSTVLLPHEQNSQYWSDHPSVASWAILSDGKVRIREAGVLASSIDDDDDLQGDLQASILIPGIFTTTPQKQTNLVRWLRTFLDAESAPNYAVSLYQQTKKIQHGLILKTVGSEGILIKIGTFFTDAVKVEDVPIREVDWIVL